MDLIEIISEVILETLTTQGPGPIMVKGIDYDLYYNYVMHR